MGDLPDYHDLPLPRSRRLLHFDDAYMGYEETAPPHVVLTVRGTMPYEGMAVELTPLVYLQRPEFWGVEVVAALPAVPVARSVPYEAALDVTGLIGTRGIEVIGAGRNQRMEVAEQDKEVVSVPVLVRGVVRDVGGWPVVGAAVSARPLGARAGEGADPQWSNRDGRFTLRLRRSGRHQVVVEAPGFHYASAELYVGEDGRARQDFHLTTEEKPAEAVPPAVAEPASDRPEPAPEQPAERTAPDRPADEGHVVEPRDVA